MGNLAFTLAGAVLARKTGYIAFCDSGMVSKVRDEAELTINKLEHLLRCIKNL